MTAEDLVAVVRALVAAPGDRRARAERVAEAVRAGGGHRWVGVYEVTATEVAILGYAGPGAPAFPRFPRDRGLTASAVASGRTVVADDVTADPRYLTAFGSTRSEMIVPVPGPDGSVIGTVDVESERVAAFGDPERRAVEACAAVLAPLCGPPDGAG
jgi:GAF domain-containing protein